MFCIAHSNTDPYFNLAAEEHFLKNFSDNCFLLYRNNKSVVIGKHQNALAEINMDFIRRNRIPVIRRISGGGTVFHDPGNLNFTFIMNGHEGHLVDFRKYTAPIIEVLEKLKITACFEGKNNLVIDGRKISGNAEHVYRKRVLHHGTLLFSSLLDDLEGALRSTPQKYKSKAVQSIRSRVTNIKEHLKQDIDVIQFRDIVMEHIMNVFPGASSYELSREDIRKINKLRNEKYLTWEWNFGYSPKYEFEKSFIINGEFIHVHLNVSGGIIQKAMITGDYSGKRNKVAVEKLLEGSRHEQAEMLERFESIPFSEYFSNITAPEFVKKMF